MNVNVLLTNAGLLVVLIDCMKWWLMWIKCGSSWHTLPGWLAGRLKPITSFSSSGFTISWLCQSLNDRQLGWYFAHWALMTMSQNNTTPFHTTTTTTPTFILKEKFITFRDWSLFFFCNLMSILMNKSSVMISLFRSRVCSFPLKSTSPVYLHYSITVLLATELPSGIHIYRFYIKQSSGPVSQGWWAWVPVPNRP